jgi:hypothetical protein
MLEQMLTAITQNPWILAIGTLSFFAIKGIFWLTIPYLAIRWRRRLLKSRNENARFDRTEAGLDNEPNLSHSPLVQTDVDAL